MTSNQRLGAAPGNVTLDEASSGLPKASVVNVSQIVALDRTRLQERVRRLGQREMVRVEVGLRLVLSL